MDKQHALFESKNLSVQRFEQIQTNKSWETENREGTCNSFFKILNSGDTLSLKLCLIVEFRCTCEIRVLRNSVQKIPPKFFAAFDHRTFSLIQIFLISQLQLKLPIYVSFFKKRTLIDFIVACVSIANKMRERRLAQFISKTKKSKC